MDCTLGLPEENLTFDDSLLDRGHETLRFWESAVHFVVLGRSGRVEEEVNVAACDRTKCVVSVMLAMVVGFFWHSDGLQFVISIVGVIVFTGLTAWDAQRLKQMAAALPEGGIGAYAVVGALSLYLDFINLFLFLLRFLGGSRRS